MCPLHVTEPIIHTSSDAVDFVCCHLRLNSLHLMQLLYGAIVAIEHACQTSGVHFQHIAPFPELRIHKNTQQ